MFNKKNILGIGITDATGKKVLEYIVKNLLNDGKKHLIVTLNPEILVLANDNVEYKKVLNSADLALIDGVGVFLAGRMLDQNFKGRITGVDLVKNLCFYVAEKPITVGFLGGGPKIAEKTVECLQKDYPGLKISFVGEEWPNGPFALKSPSQFDDSSNSSLDKPQNLARESSSKRDSLEDRFKNSSHDQAPRASKIDILFVAFGAPKQEMWIHQNLDKIPVKVAIGVGGSFDYISGKIQRAPLIIRSIGFEWLFRLIRQPWRWKRQLALLKFIYLVFKEKFRM